jgi:hypothetical protein
VNGVETVRLESDGVLIASAPGALRSHASGSRDATSA